MKNDQLQEIRNEILAQLLGNAPSPRVPDRMLRSARHAGTCVEADLRDFVRECDYLAGKGLIEAVRDPIAPGVVSYKITSAGRDYLEQQA